MNFAAIVQLWDTRFGPEIQVTLELNKEISNGSNFR
jgi:hypothetical protein